MEKIYIKYKPCDEPNLGIFSDSGIHCYEDEIGYYYLQGELICNKE